MYVARYNPILPVAALILAAGSAFRLWRLYTSPPSFNPSFFLLSSKVFIAVFILSFILLLIKNYITVDKNQLSIRNRLFQSPKIYAISDIVSAAWSVQKSGFWTRGRRTFSIKLKDGKELHFASLNFMTANKRIEFFDYLRGIGVEVSV
jgi:hypothetical protein